MQKPSNIFGRLGNSLFQYAFIYAKFLDKEVEDIYLQDPKYFDKYRKEIRKLFIPTPLFTNKVAIHVRRGDYVGNQFYVDLTQTDYYERAMAEFPNETFTVFSDDIAWCKGLDIFKDCQFSEGNNELVDLEYMAAHKGHIIANSSFSWWGAYLSTNTKKVIAPKLWYTDGVERTICPQDWIKI